MNTRKLEANPEGILEAAGILGAGGLVGFPTETVYGLGADALSSKAVARIFEAKGRPATNPLIVHFPRKRDAEDFVAFDPASTRLADAFWPGPLTLVLPLAGPLRVATAASSGHSTLAVRVPSHPAALALLQAFGGPVAAPSANISSKVSPTRASHVLADLGGRIEAVLDGGNCQMGLESTIVAIRGGKAMVLRPGAIPSERIEEAAGSAAVTAAAGDGPASPGQLAVHYAPETPVRLNSVAAGEGEILLGFGPVDGQEQLNLSPAGDLEEAGSNLYAMLRSADQYARAAGLTTIAVSPIPETGLGQTINDRLARAARRDS